MKVYGWIGARVESRVEGNHHGQTREIVGAKSLAEVARLSGYSLYHLRRFAGVTANPTELAAVESVGPGVILWAPLNGPERAVFRKG